MMFPHVIYFVKKYYAFIAIFKDNGAITYVTVQYKHKFIPVNFDGPHTRLVYSYVIKKQFNLLDGKLITLYEKPQGKRASV
jgi:hypothetical protein